MESFYRISVIAYSSPLSCSHLKPKPIYLSIDNLFALCTALPLFISKEHIDSFINHKQEEEEDIINSLMNENANALMHCQSKQCKTTH